MALPFVLFEGFRFTCRPAHCR